jgi:aminoglycoside phosphotransferase
MMSTEPDLPSAGQQKTTEDRAATAVEPPSSIDSDASQKPSNAAAGTVIHVPRPTSLQKHLLLSAIRLVRRFRRRHWSVLMLTKGLCVKYGSRIDLAEAKSMLFIARHTSIPVPTVHFAFVYDDCTYILMERIHGQPIGIDWINRPHASRQRILENLKDMITEMRKLQAHIDANSICSVTGGSLYDPRLPTITRKFGPFGGVQDFHNYLRNGMQSHTDETVSKLISMHKKHWGAPTFTHGDLSSLNILVNGDKIAGIIDWETAGWYPSYWEYTTACQVNPHSLFWRDEIDGYLEPWADALEMEHLRQRYFGDY